ncbi:MAG TPA: glycoside hydrolase family 3 C-terminal domain-containing protein [Candidatus Sulfotelmatobacter sp.]|nr:glycoside hydrolase family 3 C-terminal domain-containing protein [Candidatus Sulfotelmatobacter sp.]
MQSSRCGVKHAVSSYCLKLASAFLVSSVLIAASSRCTAQSGGPAYLDPSQPVDVRVNDLIGRMTLEEKASQLVNQARAIPRLQVPAYDWWSEALHGVANAGTATVFPEPIGLAATFDDPLIHEMAIVIGIEARAKHNQAVRAGRRDIMEGLDFWSPNINIFRDPRWGRGQETYGEDPFLTGRMGVAFVTGLQGDDPKYFRVISTPKHFAVHSGPEPTRHTIDIQVSRHDMEDTYLPAFRATVTEGKAESIMCAYNRVNGQPACANSFLLQDQLRGAWKFSGYVVSDCGAIIDIFEGHRFTKSQPEAAAAALKTGMDNECIDFMDVVKDTHDYQPYIDAVKQGLLAEADIDRALKRLFTARMRLGLFDPPEKVPYAQTPESEIDSAPHRELALNVARESMVLLKNDGVLPLAPTSKKILVVGPLAESVEVLHGNYAGTASHAVTALAGIRKQFGAQVSFEPGTNFLREHPTIPTSVLSTDDGKPGLKGEYFADDLAGAPQVTRVDPYVDLQRFHPDAHAIALPAGMNDASVRWSGFLTPDRSGRYQIGLAGSKNRMWLDGKLIVDDATLHDPNPEMSPIPLEKGHRYAVKIEYLHGGFGTKLEWLLVTDPLIDAVSAARQADVVVAVVGITSNLEGEEMKVDVPGFRGGDRTSLNLPEEEEALLGALKGTGKPLVVVLMNGSALAVNWANDHANAILDAWYSGEEGGTAIAQTLAGTNNPAGRLPVTFYKGTEQLPDFTDYSMKNRTYRYFTGEPLYGFGHGLSYTTFEYSGMKLSNASLQAGDPVDVEVDIKNTGKRDGDEVAELYIAFPKLAGAPLRALRGFTRLHLNAGEQKHVKLTLGARDMSYVNEAGDRYISAGDYLITIGGGQPGAGAPHAESHLMIQGEQKLPE